MTRRGTRGGRKHKAAPAAAAAVAPPHAPTIKLNTPVNSTGWDGAVQSPRRGFVVWPTLDTRKELPPRARKEIIRRARWGESNIGLVRRSISGVASLVGYLSPQANSGDPEWDREAEEAFARRAEQPLAFDRAGKFDFKAWQIALTRCRLRDGDALTVLTEAESTGGGQVIFYEAHQVDSGEALADPPLGLRDGVYTDSMGRPIGFRLVDPEKPARWTSVPAESSIFHADFERPGRVRGVSAVAHAISNVLDIVEILADTKHAIKIAAQFGVAMETAAGASGGNDIGEELAAFLGGGSNKATDPDNDDGLNLDTILQGGRMQATPAGSKLTTLQDTRPHPNQIALLDWLVRDIAWGIGLAPEVLWQISGMNGTATRYLMAETRRWVEGQQRILERSCQRLWTYIISREIKAGRLRPPTTDRWWKCKWIPQSDLTIDEGRVGLLELKQLAEGAITYSEVFAKRGKDWEAEFVQMQKERQRREELGLTATAPAPPPAEEEAPEEE